MTLSVVPFSAQFEGAAAAFNERMRRGHAPSAFLLPTRGKACIQHGAVTATQYLSVDHDQQVRGGMFCQEYPAVVAGRRERVVNISAPLSEGIIDPAYTFVGPALIKYALKQNPRAFVVGMGNSANPLPRLLKAMGWTVRVVPFFFRLLRAGRCVRQLRPLRTTALRRTAMDVAARTGLAALGARVVHRPSAAASRSARLLQIEDVQQWTDSTDGVWTAFAPSVSFGVERMADVLRFFYPEDRSGPRAWVLRRHGNVEGWFGLSITRMAGNQYFGDLTVATLTDCVGSDAALRAAPAAAVTQAAACGADLVITNQQHRAVAESCVAAGWRPGPSNFLLATSPALSTGIDADTTYVTRRDGDGLVNLTG